MSRDICLLKENLKKNLEILCVYYTSVSAGNSLWVSLKCLETIFIMADAMFKSLIKLNEHFPKSRGRRKYGKIE